METHERLERMERMLLVVLCQQAELRSEIAALDGQFCETGTAEAGLRRRLLLQHGLDMIGLMVRTEGLADQFEAVRRMRFPEQAG